MLEFIGHQLAVCLTPALRPAVWLIILVVIFVPLERVFAVHPQKVLRKGIVTDICYYFLSSLLPALLLGVPVGLLAWVVHQAVPGGVLAATAALPLWARVFCGLVAGEVGYYWGHRWSHEIPFLCASIPSITAPRKSTSWSAPAPIRSIWCLADSVLWCQSMC